MASVKWDTIESNSGRFTIKGWEISRGATVSGLTTAGYAMVTEAVNALGIAIGTPHPEVPKALAIEFIPESIPQTANAMRVVVMYREFAQDYIIELGSRKLMRPRTDYFPEAGKDPVPMKLYYTYLDDYSLNEKMQGLTESQGVEAEVQEYYPTIVITRTEFSSILADALSGYAVGIKLTGQMLTDRGIQYNGRVNAAGWNLRPGDGGDFWRCEITSVSAEDGLAYRVRYAFSYDPDKWEFPATFKDPFSGEPVADPDRVVDRPTPLPENWPTDDLAARNNFSVLKQQDFSLLELPL